MSTTALHRFLQNLKSILLNTVAWIFILIVHGPPFLLLYLWRSFVNLAATRLHTDLTPCSPNDTLLVYDTPDKQSILTGGFVLKVKGHIDIGKLTTLFEALFLTQQENENYQNLYCDLVKYGGYLFKRKIVLKIKLENHFQTKQLERGADFKPIVAGWFQEKFQKGLPLWQMLVLNATGDNSNDYSYFAFKAHHVLLDGYSFVHLLDKLTGGTSPGEWSRSNSPTNNNYKQYEENDKPEKSIKDDNKTVWEELKILFSVPEVVAAFTFPNVSWKDSKRFPASKPLSNFEMLPMACGTCSLEPVREIRRKLGVNFPAVVYGLQAGVLREALINGCANNSPVSEENLPENMLISTSLPVVGCEHPKNKLTNHWSGGYIKVPVKLGSAKERVLKANQSLQMILKDEGTYIIWKYLAYMLWLIPSWVHSLLDKCETLKLCKYRSSISCIPQSCTVQYSLMGLPVQNIYHAPVMKDGFRTAG